jgi:Flp pilus assembly protein TadG
MAKRHVTQQIMGERATDNRVRDAGAVTILLAVGITALIMIIALSVDVSGILRTDDRARALAEQAARAGAQQISISNALAGNGTTIDQAKVTAAACSFLPVGTDCVVAPPTSQTVTVTVTLTFHGLLNTMFGWPDFTEKATATAVLVSSPPPPAP